MEPMEESEPASAGGQPGKTVARTLSWRALGVIIAAGVAVSALIILVPGLHSSTRVALTFILAPIVVTPVLGGQGGFSRGALVVGSVLGGEMAALLYAAGQSGRFSAWLIAVELVALLLAPATLRMLRMARIPGVPRGEEMPAFTGIVLIIALSPFALAAGVLDGMARFPAAAIFGALVAGGIVGIAGGQPAEIIVAALPALLPAGVRWVILRARRPRR
jgi:hypothetical protein